MKDCDEELRRLYAAARREEAPTLEDRRAVRAALASAVAALTVNATASAAASTLEATTAASSGLGASALPVAKAVTVGKLASWVGIGFAVGAATSTGVVAVQSLVEPPPAVSAKSRSAPASSARARALPSPTTFTPPHVPSAAVSASTASEPPPEPSQPLTGTARPAQVAPSAAPERTVPAARERTTSDVEGNRRESLALESRGLMEVQSALKAGDAARALSLLREQEAAFRDGVMGEERAAARVVALCAAGRRAEALEARRQFAARYARSPLLKRVLATCGE